MLLNRWGEVEPSPKRIFVLFSRLTILNFKSVQILNRYLYDWTMKTGQAMLAFWQRQLVDQTTRMNFHFKSARLQMKINRPLAGWETWWANCIRFKLCDAYNHNDWNNTKYRLAFESVPMKKWSEVVFLLNHFEFNAVNKDFLKYFNTLKYSWTLSGSYTTVWLIIMVISWSILS